MFNSNELYKKRLSAHIKELGRYLRYILNGHIMIVLLFLISTLAIYYQQALRELPANFPTALIVGILFGLIASYNPIRTLLKEPDLVFLIVAEDRMNSYFRNTLLYSFVLQLYLVFLIAAVLGPLYFASYEDRTGTTYLLTILILIIFKLGNLLANWWMLKVRDKNLRYVDMFVRTVINMVVFYFIVRGEMVFAGIITVIFVFIFFYDYMYSRKQIGIHWDLLIEKDQQGMQAFYRFANMFAEVPHLKVRIKKRKWLVDAMTKGIAFEQNKTFDYLYRITFIRSGEYIGMYLRLVILGGIFIYFIPNMWLKVIFSILFIYLSTFQMMSIYQHHRTNMWLDLYPIDVEVRKKSVLNILYRLSFIQTVLFALIFLLIQNYLGFIVALLAGLLFSIVFINGYVKTKIG